MVCWSNAKFPGSREKYSLFLTSIAKSLNSAENLEISGKSREFAGNFSDFLQA
jgi:hypothetical protein